MEAVASILAIFQTTFALALPGLLVRTAKQFFRARFHQPLAKTVVSVTITLTSQTLKLTTFVLVLPRLPVSIVNSLFHVQ
jgi:hypothetical protein